MPPPSPDALPALPPLTPGDVLTRLVLWTFIVSAAAAPSFYVAATVFADDQPVVYAAMLAGIATYIVFYTWYACRPRFRRMWMKPITRTTLYVGYGTRVLVSMIFPISVFMDVVCGMFTAMILGAIAEPLFGNVDGYGPALAFPFFYLWTLLQGAVLNGILMVYMLLVYAVQMPFRKPYEPDPFACAQCGYDLRASGENCPECGAGIPAQVRRFIAQSGAAPAGNAVDTTGAGGATQPRP